MNTRSSTTFLLARGLHLRVETKEHDTVVTLRDIRTQEQPSIPDAIFNIPESRWSAIDCKPERPGCYLIRGAFVLRRPYRIAFAYRLADWNGTLWHYAHNNGGVQLPNFVHTPNSFGGANHEWAGCPEDFSVDFQQLIS